MGIGLLLRRGRGVKHSARRCNVRCKTDSSIEANVTSTDREVLELMVSHSVKKIDSTSVILHSSSSLSPSILLILHQFLRDTPFKASSTSHHQSCIEIYFRDLIKLLAMIGALRHVAFHIS